MSSRDVERNREQISGGPSAALSWRGGQEGAEPVRKPQRSAFSGGIALIVGGTFRGCAVVAPCFHPKVVPCFTSLSGHLPLLALLIPLAILLQTPVIVPFLLGKKESLTSPVPRTHSALSSVSTYTPGDLIQSHGPESLPEDWLILSALQTPGL